MYRVYILDRSGAYWLRRWVGAGSDKCPVLSTKRDHAFMFKRFGDALDCVQRLKELRNDAHIESDNHR